MTLIGVSFDYEKAARSIAGWVDRKCAGQAGNTVFINFSYKLTPYLPGDLGFIYYRDYISQEEELELSTQAYQAAGEFAGYVAGQSNSGNTMVSAMYHHLASDLFKFFILKRELVRLKGKHGQVVAIVDDPFINKLNYILLKGFYLKTYCMRDRLYRDEQRTLGRFSPYREPANRGAGAQTFVLILVDDSGSQVNTTSAIRIIKEFIDAGAEPVVLTGSPPALDTLKSCCENIFLLPVHPLTARGGALQSGFKKLPPVIDEFTRSRRDFVWDIFNFTMKPKLYDMFTRAVLLENVIDYLSARFAFKVALAINEGNYVPAGGISYLRSKGIPTVGVATILHKTYHPENSFWPADHHLVYGEQAVEAITRWGVPRESIAVVGSEHYDRCVRRNKEVDRQYIRDMFPNVGKRKLVVVATEARPRQMIEIEPSVRSLAAIPSVYTILKLHPDDKRAEFARMLDRLGDPPNVEIAERMDVQALLNACDLLVAMFSNLIVEAGVMGTISLVHNYSGTPCYLDFVDEGLCFGAFSEEEFERLAGLLLFDEVMRSEAIKKLSRISRFNGPNDGNSAKRVIEYALNLVAGV